MNAHANICKKNTLSSCEVTSTVLTYDHVCAAQMSLQMANLSCMIPTGQSDSRTKPRPNRDEYGESFQRNTWQVDNSR